MNGDGCFMRKIIGSILVLVGIQAMNARAAEFRMVAMQVGDTKIWYPPTLVVKAGEKVTIHASNKMPGAANNPHGLAIPEVKVAEVVSDKEKTIEFTAPKAGIYPITCHLHPAHLGGQLVVMP